MDYRPATVDDIDAIQRVAERSWEQDYPDIVSRESIRETVHEWYGEDRLRTDIAAADTMVLAAVDEDDVVGFAHGVVADDTGTLMRVYVDPDHRGEGVGRSLVEVAVDDFATRGVDRVEALVLTANDPGNEFYQRLGFEHVQRATTTIGGESYEENIYLKLV
ncbi:GNAT family N-acetyltransferase [Haloarchaeobius amylolyticus]|uniref:GNAT family N-acetyltransferase n=1 Tax=Haloarchaeobius amylolyticus TaxID=1198296 RepID=UPI00226D87C5|nr:GNAT family N-acetyltransferase [Haloarchaeobius amylolyticus]